MDRMLEQAIRERANGLCEYCHASQAHYSERFQLDHIIARQHGGKFHSLNLALCCLECNRRKGPNIGSIDPQTGQRVDLFHPRENIWNDHFGWHGAILVGVTPIGRATITLLEINRPPRVMVRETMIEEGIFPPPEEHSNGL